MGTLENTMLGLFRRFRRTVRARSASNLRILCGDAPVDAPSIERLVGGLFLWASVRIAVFCLPDRPVLNSSRVRPEVFLTAPSQARLEDPRIGSHSQCESIFPVRPPLGQ